MVMFHLYRDHGSYQSYCEHIPVTPAMAQFIHNFDFGKYPGLLK